MCADMVPEESQCNRVYIAVGVNVVSTLLWTLCDMLLRVCVLSCFKVFVYFFCTILSVYPVLQLQGLMVA